MLICVRIKNNVGRKVPELYQGQRSSPETNCEFRKGYDMKLSIGASIMFFIIVLFIVVSVGGWCLNVHKLTQCDFASPYKAEFIRCVGIIPPVGAVIGYFDIDD